MSTFKEQCIALRKKDCTLNEIVELTGRSKTSIYAHIRHIPLSAAKRKEISTRARDRALQLAQARRGISSRPYRPFVHWSPEMVLLVAHLSFDGSINKSCAYNNRSTALIQRVQDLMEHVYDFKPTLWINTMTGVRRISYHNVALAGFMAGKSLELLRNITTLSHECQRSFLRAFFDDEGCMDFRPLRNVRQVRGYQKKRQALFVVQILLKNFKIASALRGTNEIVISGKENLKKFQDEICFSPGVGINSRRTNSIWKQSLEKRELLRRAILSFKT